MPHHTSEASQAFPLALSMARASHVLSHMSSLSISPAQDITISPLIPGSRISSQLSPTLRITQFRISKRLKTLASYHRLQATLLSEETTCSTASPPKPLNTLPEARPLKGAGVTPNTHIPA